MRAARHLGAVAVVTINRMALVALLMPPGVVTWTLKVPSTVGAAVSVMSDPTVIVMSVAVTLVAVHRTASASGPWAWPSDTVASAVNPAAPEGGLGSRD